MKLLIVKMSSLGDVFHTFPALTEAKKQIPDLEVTWVVEESFASMAAWHPAVTQVIPIAWRRWRKELLSKKNRNEMRTFWKQLKSNRFDRVLDAQGLIKSGIVTSMARGSEKCGFDKHSIKESFAAHFYSKHFNIPKGKHAIWRLRQLFANALNYEVGDETHFSYGLNKSLWCKPDLNEDYLVFLHGTTWETKLWPEAHWKTLAKQSVDQGLTVLLPWGNDEEKQRAERIAQVDSGVKVLPKLGLSDLTAYLSFAKGVVGVDTGLSHVVAGLEVPAVAIYGATDPTLTGVLGPHVTVVNAQFDCAPCLSKTCQYKDEYPPCYGSTAPNKVWQALENRFSK